MLSKHILSIRIVSSNIETPTNTKNKINTEASGNLRDKILTNVNFKIKTKIDRCQKHLPISYNLKLFLRL